MDYIKRLSTQFIQIAPQMIRTVKSEIRAAADGRLTHAQFRILATIYRGQNTVGQIATEHGVSQPSMSKMVESLVKKSLVQRTASKTDRRQVSLQLSAKGLKLFTDLKDKAADSLTIKIKKLSKDQQKDLAQALDHLQSLLQELHKDSV
ncbi:MAG: MarR family transcriptional regulator [Bdellovibrio sp.]|nr:MarR family transcriptional regulator [Bdellovibrio sp.]